MVAAVMWGGSWRRRAALDAGRQFCLVHDTEQQFRQDPIVAGHGGVHQDQVGQLLPDGARNLFRVSGGDGEVAGVPQGVAQAAQSLAD